MAAEKGDFIRAVIRARRRAVEFMHQNPDEAGDIVAKHYNLEPEVARAAVRNLHLEPHQRHSVLGHRPDPPRRPEAHDRGAAMVGAIKGEVDLNKIIDTRFLPDDIGADDK